MTPRMFESMRKFCPRSRLGRTPKAFSRRSVGCAGCALGHHPKSAAALRSTSASSSS